MKTTKVAEMLGIDAKTVTNWTSNPELNEFFSLPARTDSKARTYNEDDVLVLNTIRVLREGNMDWVDIAQRLDDNYRDSQLPPSALLVNTTTALATYNQLGLAQQRITDLETEVERLRGEVERRDEMREEIGLLKGFLRANGIDPKTGRPINESK
ncbi:MAG: MerR family transcriptional regulator [Chloroflexota bacterium]